MIYWPWLPLEEMMKGRENEEIKEFERMRKPGGVRKRKGKERFL